MQAKLFDFRSRAITRPVPACRGSPHHPIGGDTLQLFVKLQIFNPAMPVAVLWHILARSA
jgi:hypothetical protein